MPPGTPSISAIVGGLVSEVMAQDEDSALLRLQPAERAIHDVAIDHASELVAARVVIDVKDLELGVPASVTACVLDAHVREHALEPVVEPVRIAEARQVTPGDHQRVLQGILGPVDVPKDPTSDREQAVDARANQVHEGDPIATLRRDHELSIHRRYSAGRPSGTSSIDSGGWCALSVERCAATGGRTRKLTPRRAGTSRRGSRAAQRYVAIQSKRNVAIRSRMTPVLAANSAASLDP